MAMQEKLGPTAGAAMLAGLNGLAVSDGASLEWVNRLLKAWRECGPALRHLELGDTTRPGDLRTVMADLRGLSSSVGLSLSELLTLWGPSADVAAKALELAHRLECPCIVVHADRWSLAVHRSDPGCSCTPAHDREPLGFGPGGSGRPVSRRDSCQLHDLRRGHS